jgi:signal transduction histidine kinase
MAEKALSSSPIFRAEPGFSPKAQLALLSFIIFVVLTISSYLLVSAFAKMHLNALVKSQSYAVAVQEWRAVANGIMSGWTIVPGIQSLCVSHDGAVALALGQCEAEAGISVRDWFAGRRVGVSDGALSLVVELSMSIWPLVLGLALVLTGLIFLLFLPIQKPFTARAQLGLLKRLGPQPDLDAAVPKVDVTVLRQAQEILKLREEAALVSLARQVAHDIRSPLAALSAIPKIAGQMDPSVQNLVRGATERIREIANELLFQGKIASAPYKLRDLLVTVEAEKRLEIEDLGSQAKVRLEFLGDVDVTLEAPSKLELHRVLSNVLNNSIEANARDICLRLSVSPDKWEIIISDDGCGIPAELINKVASGGYSHGKKQGSGLGLAHANRVIEAVNGRVTIDSAVGRGTALTLEAPRNPISVF